jgi:hypothetical protein
MTMTKVKDIYNWLINKYVIEETAALNDSTKYLVEVEDELFRDTPGNR